MIVDTFASLNDKKLIVVGDGPDFKKISSVSYPNIEFKGHLPFDELKFLMQNAKAFVFAANEDFGILPVEAMACGTPVICYGKGGVLETVQNGITGVHFREQTVEDLALAIAEFEKKQFPFRPAKNKRT